MRHIITVAGILALAGCAGGEPSETDIQAALQALERRSEIVNIDKTECNEAGEGRLRCSFAVTAKSGNWERTREMSSLFEQRESGWAVAGE